MMINLYRSLIILFLIMVSSFPGTSQTFDVVTKGQDVPEFTINLEDGKNLKISDYKGSVVLMNFFATWCGPCRKEMPFLQKDVWIKFKDKENFKMLSIGRGHDQAEVDSFKESQNLGFPIYGDQDKSIL